MERLRWETKATTQPSMQTQSVLSLGRLPDFVERVVRTMAVLLYSNRYQDEGE